MKLKDTFVACVTDGENILLDAGGSNFVGMVRSNETAAFIVNCLKEETSAEQITAAMCREYDAPKEIIAADVARVLETLRSIHALEE